MINFMYPILARYGSLFIFSFTVVMALGVIIGIGLLNWLAKRKPAAGWFDVFLVLMLAALIAGRVGFIISRWDYFRDQPFQAWQLWLGGYSYHTALLGGLAALIIWAAVTKRPFYRYAALFAPALIMITFFGWAACWMEGCAYGQETILGLLTADLPDEYGVFAVRYQTQLTGMFLALTAFLFILWYQKDRPEQLVFWMALAIVSLIHLAVTLFRGDPTFTVGVWRLDTLLNVLLAAISLTLLQYERRKSNQAEDYQ